MNMINEALLNPGSIAVIGASKSLEKPGGRLVLNLLEGGYTGKIYPVNPKESEIQGLKVYNLLSDLPETELAIIALAAADCVQAVQLLATTKTTKAFIIISAGFSEMGEEGKKLENSLKELAKDYKLTIIGPNCIGVMNSSYKAIFVSPLPPVIEGGVDFVSASGALAVFLFELAAKYGMRFGSVYTVGNSVDNGVEEILEYWNENFIPGRSGLVKMVYVEQIRKPVKFFSQINQLRQRGCHVLVLKPGDSEAGARAALSHTGSFAGDAQAFGWLIQKAGAIRCYSRLELVYLANILTQRELKGKNLAVITHAGGPGVMLTDQLQKSGLLVPEIESASQTRLLSLLNAGSSAKNPIDMLATANRTQLSAVVSFCDNYKSFDGAVVIYGKTGMEDLFETYRELHKSISQSQKPVYCVLPAEYSGREETECFVSLGNSIFCDEVLFAQCLEKVIHEPSSNNPEPITVEIVNKRNLKLKTLDEVEVWERLKWGGIPKVKTCIVRSPDDISSLDTFTYPVAAKVMGILHKTEVGGVVLNIADLGQLRSAVIHLLKIDGSQGVQVQEMLTGTELYLGGKKHPGTGYSVHFGLGGIFIELMRDVASTLAPVNFEEAFELLSGLRANKIFDGFRGLPPVDKAQFARLITDFSQLFAKYPDIAEIDINPLIASPEQIVAVDARIIVEIPE